MGVCTCARACVCVCVFACVCLHAPVSYSPSCVCVCARPQITTGSHLPPLAEVDEGDDVDTLPLSPFDQASVPSLQTGARKKIGGKLKVNYVPEVRQPTANPYTDVDEEEETVAHPPPHTHAPIASMRSPKQPKKRAPKIPLDYSGLGTAV